MLGCSLREDLSSSRGHAGIGRSSVDKLITGFGVAARLLAVQAIVAAGVVGRRIVFLGLAGLCRRSDTPEIATLGSYGRSAACGQEATWHRRPRSTREAAQPAARTVPKRAVSQTRSTPSKGNAARREAPTAGWPAGRLAGLRRRAAGSTCALGSRGSPSSMSRL